MILRICLLIIVILPGITASSRSAQPSMDPLDFDRFVAPLLSKRCLECHNASDHKGKLDLSSAAVVLRRQEPLIIPGKLDDSLLWQRVLADEMPPKKPLTDAEKAILKEWIEGGAKWGKTDPIDRYAISTDKRAGADWWSLQPVKRTEVPVAKANAWIKNPVDAFVLAKLEGKGLIPSPPANPQLLIRRVYFDLIGLPPTPKEMEDFVSDQDPQAYEKLLDRLLASPHYGERWARHWLDVARYTESQGFEYDRIRPNAWHYRDYVIKSFNEDKPYNLFVQEQLAGDVINFASPQADVTSEGIVATSLLVCGPWDQAGNSQANVTQRMITREEEMEDLVSVVGQSFMGLTINCARCHSHKYDPISQVDYYRFKSVFEGVRHGERSLATKSESSAWNKKVVSLQRAISDTEKKISQIEQEARKKIQANLDQDDRTVGRRRVIGPSPMARWTFNDNAKDQIGSMHGELMGSAIIRNGRLIINGESQYFRTASLAKDIREKTLEAWVALPTLDQGGGGVITLESADGGTFDSIVYAERNKRTWMVGSNGFSRTRDFNTAQETVQGSDLIHVAITYAGDNTITMYRNGKQHGDAYKQDSLQTYKAGEAHVLLGLRHTGAGNGFLNGAIRSAALYDRALKAEEMAASFASGPDGGPCVTNEQMLAVMTGEQSQQLNRLKQRTIELRNEIQALPPLSVSYAGVRNQPAPTHRLVRGEVTSPAEAVAPGPIAIIKTPNSTFDLKPDAPEGKRRIKLAQWLADSRHPLTARVMVNRLWHYHFGRGIVETPNDFGFNGARPTHPELLDWLSAEFVETKPAWSIKRMHKLIMMSATYRQDSKYNERSAALDNDNTLLWRYTPKRLEGEIIRDAMLAMSGQLNKKFGGPSFRPFLVKNFNSDFYEIKDMIGHEYDRRTIYRIHVNSGKSMLMDALDCPDPSIKTPTRRVTTTPLAALALMNNSFVQRQAKHLAERVVSEAKSDESKSIALAYAIVLGRSPTSKELKEAAQLVKEHGLTTLCWTLFNATEFLYVR